MAISHDYHTLDYTSNDCLLPDAVEATTLLSLLTNPLLLCHTVDYLPISAALNLAAVSREFRSLLYQTPSVFRRLDLSIVSSAQFDIDPIDQGGETWRNVQLDENVTEDEYVSNTSPPLPVACVDLPRSASMPAP